FSSAGGVGAFQRHTAVPGPPVEQGRDPWTGRVHGQPGAAGQAITPPEQSGPRGPVVGGPVPGPGAHFVSEGGDHNGGGRAAVETDDASAHIVHFSRRPSRRRRDVHRRGRPVPPLPVSTSL